MKKLIILFACGAMLASCGMHGDKQLKSENDSLKVQLSQRDSSLNDMMATFNDVQDGFRKISEAENRVNLQRTTYAENSQDAKQTMVSDIEFISKQMQENREQISRLKDMLKRGNYKSVQLKKAIQALTDQLEEKQKQIEELQSELAAKNIRINELDAAVTNLTTDKEDLSAQNEAKAKTVAQQDKSLNAAWFVFGTKSELKKQRILQGGDVLHSADFNNSYFTQIDIRTTKEIKLFAKHAEVLTTHPAGTYELAKDENKELTLKITNPKEFWSISKYLVIKVR
ncbi:MAG: hypothetical protein WCR45_05520 [Bacteroidaceae bacterium]|nr:hypothetical protein [Bacteroidaceae bacterium]